MLPGFIQGRSKKEMEKRATALLLADEPTDNLDSATSENGLPVDR